MKTFSINKIVIASFAILLTAFLFSCQKDVSSSGTSSDGLTEEQAATYSDESVQSDGSFEDLDEVDALAADADNAAATGRTANGYFPNFHDLRLAIGDCATVTVFPNDSTYPKTITVNFGDSCVGNDGKLRSGKIIIHLTAPIRTPGAIQTTTLVNYHVNHVHLEGTKIRKNLSTNDQIKFFVKIEDGKVTFPSGRGYRFEMEKTKVQIAGMATVSVLDNVYRITGWSRTKYNNGVMVAIETVDPLIKKVICPWLSDGTLKIKINNRVFKLDYGFPHNGDCDNKALLLWNDGNSQRVITLP